MPNGLWKEIEAVMDVFDEILTIHPYNCSRYGFRYLPYIYAKPELTSKIENLHETTLFFCGVAEEYRQKLIYEIIQQCEKKGIDFEIYLKPCGHDWIKKDNVHYSEMSYEQNVQRIQKAKCILEIMHEGYVGITQRYLEAIIYNKKLLTNNAEIMNLPYYETGYIRYFEKIEDIDWNWISSDDVIDYHYQGEFEKETWKRNVLALETNH